MAYATTYIWSDGLNLDIDNDTDNGSETDLIEVTASMSGGNATLTLPSVETTGSTVDLGWTIQIVDTGSFVSPESSTITIVPNPNDTLYTYKINGDSSFIWKNGSTTLTVVYSNYGVWYIGFVGKTISNPTNNRILTSLDTGGVYSNAETNLTFDGSDLNLIGGNGATGSDGMLFAQGSAATSSGTKFVHQSGTVAATSNTDFVVAFNAGVDSNLLGVTCDVACYSPGSDSFYAKVMFAALYNDDSGGDTIPTAETIYIFKDTSTAIFTLDAVTASSAAELVLNIANASAEAYEVQVFWQINNASYDAP
jgi:hypothetical protein